MEYGERTILIVSFLAVVVDGWNDALGDAYVCSNVVGGVGYDSSVCTTDAYTGDVCSANTYVNANSKCECISNGDGYTGNFYTGNSFISDGATNVNRAVPADTCQDCGVVTANTDAYNGFLASLFYTGDATSCSCIDSSFRPTNGKCTCIQGTHALESNDPANNGNTFSCVLCSDIIGGPGFSDTCSCNTGDCNDDLACAANAIVNPQYNCECKFGFTEHTSDGCLDCANLQSYNLITNPLGSFSGSCTQPCSTLDKKPDTSGICQCPTGQTLAARTWSSTTDVTEFDCVDCTSVTTGPGNDATTCTAGGAACAANAVPDEASGECRCYTDLATNVKYLEASDGNSCVSCQNIPAGDLLATSGDATCECATYAQPDTSNSNECTCQTNYMKAGKTWDSDGAVTEYECILCSTLQSGPGFDVAGCQCAANALPDSAGVCRCLQGYLTSLDGNSCVDCSSITSNDLVDLSAVDSFCASPCVTYAAPDTSTSDNLCTCQTSASESHTFWDADGERACILWTSMTGVGASTTDGTCGLQAYLKESGQCACLDSTANVPSGVSPSYNTGSTGDFCYRTGTTEECVKDGSTSIGLLYATCTTTGMNLLLNENCRSGDYSTVEALKFYVGTNPAACNFASDGTNHILSDSDLDFASPGCEMTSVDDGTYTTYTASINYDATGVQFSITTGTISCKVENANPANAEAVQVTGWSFEIPDYTQTIDAYDSVNRNMPSIVTMTHNIPNTNQVNLGDLIQISINEVIANVFDYRIDKAWISTSGTLTDFAAGTDPKFLILNNGCPTVPCWAEIKTQGRELEFRAVKFSTANTIYLYSQIYLCMLGSSCDVSGACPTCAGAHDPTGRRRRSTNNERKPVLIRQEIQIDTIGNPRILKRAKEVQAPYGTILIVPEDMTLDNMLMYYEHNHHDIY